MPRIIADSMPSVIPTSPSGNMKSISIWLRPSIILRGWANWNLLSTLSTLPICWTRSGEQPMVHSITFHRFPLQNWQRWTVRPLLTIFTTSPKSPRAMFPHAGMPRWVSAWRSKDIFVHVYFYGRAVPGNRGSSIFLLYLECKRKYGMAEWNGVWNRLLILHRKYHRVVVTA